MNDIAAGAPLDILAAKAAPIECVPAVMDLNLLPDMGRMTERLPSLFAHWGLLQGRGRTMGAG
jgi:hypothetical protein